MAAVHPTAMRIQALRRRWDGQGERLQAIARDMRAGRDWTVHLRGLPLVSEIPPIPGEAYGRDLRGADLRRTLRPRVDVRLAEQADAARVVAITMEALRNNTALPDGSPFPHAVEDIEQVALALRRGERILLAVCDEEPIGVVRLAARREFEELTRGRPYLEISNLAVRLHWRGSGVGGCLLADAERRAASSGHELALLRTTLEVGLVPWYERLGYEQRLVRQLTYEGAPAFLDVVMTKRVAAAVEQDTIPRARPRIIRNGRGGSVSPGASFRLGGGAYGMTFR